MPEPSEAIRDLANTMVTKFTPPSFVPGCEVKDITDIDEYTTDNGWIEAIVGGDNQQRVRYYGTPQGVGVGDFVDVEYFPAYKLYRVFGSTLGGTAATGGVRVDRVWKSGFDAPAMYADADGGIGIGTETTPHGGVGAAKLAIDGTNASVAGPHIQLTTTSDDYPLLQILAFGRDNTAFSFDAYYDGAWKSSDAGSNFQLYKVTDELRLTYESGVAQGGAVTWTDGLTLNVSGQVGIKNDLYRLADSDTKISFTDDAIEFTAGNLSMLKLTETAQDLVEIGDVSGGGDVDINFNDGDMFFQGSNGRLGVGTITPASVSGAAAGASVHVEVSGDLFPAYRMGRVSGGAFTNRQWAFGVDGGGRWFVQDVTGAVNRIFVDTSGNMSIGQNLVPAAKLHVDQFSTTAAIPVTSLDQADLSEEFINFITTVGAGNPIDTAAIGTYYGKARVAVNGTFKYVALYNS
jgi:hypothetical protein